jgi:sterol desaturase/sphingolipid hydroxylase (fatty acid hydroxylase superfamily)
LEPRGYFFWLLVVSALSFGLERLFTWRTKQPVLRRDLLQDIFWLVFNGHFAGVLIAIPAARAVEEIAALFGLVGLAEPASIAWLGAAPLAVQFVVVLVLKDFLEWSIHRLLHRVPWLWTFHKVHHSIEALDWIGSFRFHWMEIVIYRALTYLPLVILGIDGRAMLAIAVVGTLIGHLNHANIRWDWGPLRYVINSPRFHVWHHDRTLHVSHGQNFAIIFPAWDFLFGTAYLPGDTEQPEALGFAGDETFPRSTAARLVHPLPTRWPPARTQDAASR